MKRTQKKLLMPRAKKLIAPGNGGSIIIPGARKVTAPEMGCLCGTCQVVFYADQLFVGGLAAKQKQLPKGKILMRCPNCGHEEVCDDIANIRGIYE